MVALEAARVTQLLPHDFRAAEPSCASGASSYAQVAYPGDRLPAAGRPVSDVTVFMQIFKDYVMGTEIESSLIADPDGPFL